MKDEKTMQEETEELKKEWDKQLHGEFPTYDEEVYEDFGVYKKEIKDVLNGKGDIRLYDKVILITGEEAEIVDVWDFWGEDIWNFGGSYLALVKKWDSEKQDYFLDTEFLDKDDIEKVIESPLRERGEGLGIRFV